MKAFVKLKTLEICLILCGALFCFYVTFMIFFLFLLWLGASKGPVCTYTQPETAVNPSSLLLHPIIIACTGTMHANRNV